MGEGQSRFAHMSLLVEAGLPAGVVAHLVRELPHLRVGLAGDELRHLLAQVVLHALDSDDAVLPPPVLRLRLEVAWVRLEHLVEPAVHSLRRLRCEADLLQPPGVPL